MARLGGGQRRGDLGVGAPDGLSQGDQNGDGDHGNESKNQGVLDEGLPPFTLRSAKQGLHYFQRFVQETIILRTTNSINLTMIDMEESVERNITDL